MISYCVMMHPKRQKYLSYLQGKIPNLKLSMDCGRGVWDTARRAWLSYDKDKEYHCVVQDDIIPCEGFTDKVEELIREHGDQYVYCLFIRNKGQKSLEDKWKKGFEDGYLLWWKLNWALAVVIPTKHIEDMVAYCDKMTDKKYINRDDERMKHYFKSIEKTMLYPLPCLVQHREEEDSLIGLGHNRGRRAVKFIDDENTKNNT